MNTQNSGWQKLFLAARSSGPVRKYFNQSVINGVPIVDIYDELTSSERKALKKREKVSIWGLTSPSSWKSVESGDYVSFYDTGFLRSFGKVLFTKDSETIADRTWNRIKLGNHQPYRYLMIFDWIELIEFPYEVIRNESGYKKSFVQNFMPVQDEVLFELLKRYGSIESMFLSRASANYHSMLNVRKGRDYTAAEVAKIDHLNRLIECEGELRVMEQLAAELTPQSAKRLVNIIKRDRKVAKNMKKLFGDKCQICGFTFKQKNGKLYSEYAHIRPIHFREKGIDRPSNGVVLCPNHHKQLDLGYLKILSKTEYEEDGVKKKFLQPIRDFRKR